MKNTKKSGFFFNEDIRYLTTNFRFKFLYQLIAFIFGFLITWCFANFTTTEFYGTYLFIISMNSLFLFLSFAGISQSLIQAAASGYDYFLISSIRKTFKFALLGTISIIIYSLIYIFLIEFNLIIFVCLIINAVYFPFSSAYTKYLFFLQGKGEFKKEFTYRSINLIIENFLLLTLILFTRNIILYFLLLSLVLLFNNIIFTQNSKKMIEYQHLNPKLDREALNLGLFLTKYGFITLISLNISNFIVGLFFGLEKLAFYAIGTSFSVALLGFIKASLSVLLTKFSQRDSQISKSFIFFLILGSIILFIGVNLVFPFYIHILFPSYLNSISYGFAYSFLFLIYPLVVIFGYYFSAKVEKKVIKKSRSIPDLLSILLVYPLILVFGIYGIIFAEFLKNFFRLIIYIAYRSRINFT